MNSRKSSLLFIAGITSVCIPVLSWLNATNKYSPQDKIEPNLLAWINEWNNDLEMFLWLGVILIVVATVAQLKLKGQPCDSMESSKNDEITSKIMALKDLLDNGIITDAEFEEGKKKILDN